MNVLWVSALVRNASKNMTQGGKGMVVGVRWSEGREGVRGAGESSFVLEQQTRSSVAAATEHHHNQIPAL